MIRKPKLKSFLTVFPISENTWGLRGGSEELWRIKLNGERSVSALSGLLPFLDGHHEVEEILARVEQRGADREAARSLLEQLESSAFLEEGANNGLSPREWDEFHHQLTFFSRFTTAGGARFQAALKSCRIAVVGDGSLSRIACRQLAAAGFGEVVVLAGEGAPGASSLAGSFAGNGRAPRVSELDRDAIWPAELAGEPPQIVLFPQEAHDPQLLEAMDAFSKEHDVPWMLLRTLDPHLGWVGPLFIPGETASYLSLEARLRGNVAFYEECQAFDRHLRDRGRPSPSTGGLSPFFEMLVGIAVTEIVKLVSGFSIPHLAGRFLTVNLLTWETEVHEVLRVPRLEAGSHHRPRVFPWKELSYGDKQTRRA